MHEPPYQNTLIQRKIVPCPGLDPGERPKMVSDTASNNTYKPRQESQAVSFYRHTVLSFLSTRIFILFIDILHRVTGCDRTSAARIEVENPDYRYAPSKSLCHQAYDLGRHASQPSAIIQLQSLLPVVILEAFLSIYQFTWVPESQNELYLYTI